MGKVVKAVGDAVESVWDATVGAVFDKLSPNIDQPEQDTATLAKGLQKGIDKPRRITFGRDRVGGVIAHQATIERGEKEFIQLIILINGAPIDALEDVYLANKPLSNYPSDSYDYELADGRHTQAIPKAVKRMAGWTDKHVGNEQAHVYIEFENNRDVFPDGISDCEFLIRGARVWDPRDASQNPDDKSTWKWSQNAVLCTLHYVRFYGANHVPNQHLPLNWWKAAANVCDEQVPYTTASGQTKHEPRYTVDGTFSFTSKPLEVLQQLERSFAGKVFRQMGQWYVRVGAWYGNPTYTVTTADIRGDVQIKWHADLRSRANIMRAQFVDPNQQYERTDAPPVIADGYLEKDGQQLEQTINLPFVRSSATAQRLAAIALEQTRLGAIELPLRHVGLRAAVGRTIKVNIPEYHINNKTYRVVGRKFKIDGAVTLECIEDSAALWEDGLVPGVNDLTPNTNYVPGQLKPIETLTASVRSDGYYMLTWSHDTPDAVMHYTVDIYVIEGEQKRRIDRQLVNFQTALLSTLQVGEFIAQVKAVNVRGKASAPHAIDFKIDIPQPPQVLVDVSDVSVTLSAILFDNTLGTKIEWQWLGSDDAPAESPIVTSNVYTKNGLTPNTTYKYQCRAVNNVGESDWVVRSVTTEEAVKHIRLSTLSFELTQSPTWTGTGIGWTPANLSHTVKAVLYDKVSKTLLAYQAFTVTLDDTVDAQIFIEQTEDRLNKTELPFELLIEENGTSSVTATVYYDGESARQTFSAIGVGPGDLKEITERLGEMDELAESVLEQALNAENVFDADLKSTLHLEEKTDITNAVINEAVAVQASENEVMATKISTVKSELEENKAQITDVSQTLVNTEKALATKISTVKSEVEDSKAQIVEVSQTLATAEQAISAQITQLSSTVEDNHAEITTYYITKADSESAVSQAKTELQSKVANNLAYLNNTFYTAATTDDVIASETKKLRAEYQGNHAEITTNYYTKSAANQAIAAKVNTLKAQIGEDIAGLSEVYFTKVDNDGALANFVRNVSVTTASGTASVYSHMTAQANKLGQLEGRVSIGVDVNNQITGLDITPGRMQVKAGVFELLDNSNNRAVYFDSSAGRYSFKGHINATSGSFTGHVNATSGSFSGSVYATNGTFKGRVEASSGSFTGHINATSGSFSGNIYATSGTINSATLRSCTWDAGNGSTITASSGMLALRQNGVINTRLLASGESFHRNMFVYNNGISNSTGIYVKYHNYGIQVDAGIWALYARSGEIGPHTSAHETLLPKQLTPEPGDILCDDELMHIANISNAICTAKLSSSPMDVTARGVYTRRRTLTDSQPAGLVGFDEWEQLAYLYDVASINAGGEGAMNVCGEGGNLQTGDLICSSSMHGKGMRQPTQSEERYTIAQVRHNVTFDSPDQVKMVAVIYKRG
ncbi:hypothetical protein HG263_06930 [Pseudoalteromonas sp. JBTF-M23]|uniref:Fibronectin type-III domain-containing protein n=1 Tax=Pseudoalteromonas caenipelagi TaxID=2726988 RepID=A0A849VBA2_9GAMM|nr:phage tail protein [Pseudoalteromonas caenipelagi]NOU50275.1 hypothetical protein [Pseudoalteromonas caenipelagi]